MALNGNDRADAISTAIISAYGSVLDAGEQADLTSRMRVVVNADTSYLTSNATITPNTFAAGGDPVTGTGELT